MYVKNIFFVYFQAEDVKEVFELSVKKILEQETSIKDWCQSETSSSLLQCLLTVLSKFNVKLCKKLAKFLTNEVFSEISNIFQQQQPLIRLMETLIQVSGSCENMDKIFNHFYTTLFKGNISKICTDPVSGKFSVQKLIQNCKNKELFEKIYEEELDNNIGLFLQSGSGILLAIAQTCRSLKSKQAHFLVVCS